MQKMQNNHDSKPQKKEDGNKNNGEKYVKLSFNVNTELRGKGFSKEDSLDLARFIITRYVLPIFVIALIFIGFYYLMY